MKERHGSQRMQAIALICLLLAVLIAACPADAQELFISGGVTQDADTHTTRDQWSVNYIQGLGRYAAFGFSYINEGHEPNHFRDGIAAQLWGQVKLGGTPLSVALGVGPYGFCDTNVGANDTYQNLHGLGIVSSAAATWYGWSPFLLQARVNHIYAHDSFNTLSASLGIGWVLDVPVSLGVAYKPAPPRQSTVNEITAYGGITELNSAKSEHKGSFSIEYRRGVSNYFDWSVAWLTEGVSDPIDRYGVTAKLWFVHPIIRNHLEFGIGAGPYVALDRSSMNDGRRTILAADVGVMAVWWFSGHFGARAAWSRIITGYSRDTDVFLGGLTYRF
jgi:hypothetical protein